MSYLYKDTIEKLQKMRFFVYLRRSSEDCEDRQIASIPRQIREVEEEIIKKYRLNVIKPYYQESQSAFKEGRSYFNELLQRVRAGEADGIITWHANRLARNYGDGGRFVQTVSDKYIKIVLTCFGFFENTPRDLEYLMTEFTRAARDSGDKSEAVKSGNREQFFEKRKWLGPAKQGYLNTTDPITKEKCITVDSQRFPLLQKAARLILSSGYTPMQALDELNNTWGYRTRKTARQGGKPMCKSAFYTFLSDPYYFGLMIRREGEIMGSHTPMFTRQEFERLQIIIGKKGKPHNTKHEFPYKQALKCGGCGGSVTAEKKWQLYCKCKTKFTIGKKTLACPNCHALIEEMKKPRLLCYIYLHCTKKVHKDCTQRSITIDDLEEQIDKELKRYEIPMTFRDWAIQYLNELNDVEISDRETIRKNLKSAYDDCTARIDSLLRLKISLQNVDDKAISEEEYIAQRKLLLDEKESLLRQINETDARQNNWLELSEKTFDFVCYARYWFMNGDIHTKTQILAALGSNILLKDKKLLIEGHKPFFLIEKGKEEIKNLGFSFEPKKQIDLSIQTPLLEAVRSCLLRGLESNQE